MTYQILKAETLDVLESHVRFYVHAGWEPAGGVACGTDSRSISGVTWAQAIYLRDAERTEQNRGAKHE